MLKDTGLVPAYHCPTSEKTKTTFHMYIKAKKTYPIYHRFINHYKLPSYEVLDIIGLDISDRILVVLELKEKK